jgi:hypothetical protein
MGSDLSDQQGAFVSKETLATAFAYRVSTEAALDTPSTSG